MLSVLALSTNDLGVTASINAHIDISFGLTIAAAVAVLKTAKETIMGNLNGLMASVWCGAAFLRSPVEKSQPQTRDRCASRELLPRVNAGGSTPPLRTTFNGARLSGER
jgi:hypothetical protein